MSDDHAVHLLTEVEPLRNAVQRRGTYGVLIETELRVTTGLARDLLAELDDLRDEVEALRETKVLGRITDEPGWVISMPDPPVEQLKRIFEGRVHPVIVSTPGTTLDVLGDRESDE